MLETLTKRLKQQGGIHQEQRMQRDKLQTLRKALLYSYQAATAVVSAQDEDGNQKLEQFRCLINPDKLKGDYDNKILSIPYQDICLNEFPWESAVPGPKDTKLKPGDVFLWKQTNTHWLLYLQYHEQDAYFRCDIRRCDQQIQVNGKKYWVYIRGPVETSIQWNQKASIEWNDLNHSLVMYITNDENTNDYFHRFTKVKVEDPNSRNKPKTWQVVNANAYFGDGVIEVYLDEYFENAMQDARIAEQKQKQNNKPVVNPNSIHIKGPDVVRCYDKATYSIKNTDGGYWQLNRKGKLSYFQESDIIDIFFDTGKSSEWTLTYIDKYTRRYSLNIQIKSL